MSRAPKEESDRAAGPPAVMTASGEIPGYGKGNLPPNIADAEGFLDEVEDVSRLIEGLHSGKISAEYVDKRIAEKAAEEETAAKKEKENEEDAEKRKYENLPEEKKKEVKQKVRARAVSVVPRVERRSTIARAECLKLKTRAIRRSVARRPNAAVPDRALTSPNPPSANRSTR